MISILKYIPELVPGTGFQENKKIGSGVNCRKTLENNFT